MEESATDVLSGGRSVDSEILFEKIKALPKRSQYYGIHRKLSWHCQKEIRQYERDFKLFSKEFVRSEARMRERMERLKKRRRELIESGAHSSVLVRRRVRQINPAPSATWRFETNVDESTSCKIIEILVTEEDQEDSSDQKVTSTLRREQTVGTDSSTSLLPRDKATTAEKIRSLSSTGKKERQTRLISLSGHSKNHLT